jgi:ComF family protein
LKQQMTKWIRWLAPAYCLLCKQPHHRAKPICNACEAGFSLNSVACAQCALPLSEGLETSDALTHLVSQKSFRMSSAQPLACLTCSRRPPDFDNTLAPFLMRTGFRTLIHLWKFQNRPQLTRLLAQLFLDAMARHNAIAPPAIAEQTPRSTPVLLVPIPTQWERQIRRGFDHTWLLAHALHTLWHGASAVSSALRNQQPRKAQHRMSRNARWAHSETRFSARSAVCNRQIVLIDDVMTTGATARAAATACRVAGAQAVTVWCLARTPATPAAR